MLFSNFKLRELSQDRLAIEFIDDVLKVSCYSNASDIHLEPFHDKFVVRMRLDGLLKNMGEYDILFFPPIVTRAKLLSNLDIAERRKPQDGSLIFTIPGSEDEVHFRTSVIPTIYGEKMVLRRLSDKQDISSFFNLGMPDSIYQQWKRLIHKPHGIILLSGPTGSGKTTTLFATLRLLNSENVNITTIEDPVEYKIEGINQTQINSVKISFADALRSVLRQDPDIIMVGEIRDRETAEIALRASLTGHKVYSSVHTNDSVSSLTRLIDMGIEPFLVSSSINAILAQRLIRTSCTACIQSHIPTEFEQAYLKIGPDTPLQKSKGCSECNYTGYSGRTGIYELMEIDENIAKMIIQRESNASIRQYARKHLQMQTLFDSAKEKVLEGITTPEEMERILGEVLLEI